MCYNLTTSIVSFISVTMSGIIAIYKTTNFRMYNVSIWTHAIFGNYYMERYRY